MSSVTTRCPAFTSFPTNQFSGDMTWENGTNFSSQISASAADSPCILIKYFLIYSKATVQECSFQSDIKLFWEINRLTVAYGDIQFSFKFLVFFRSCISLILEVSFETRLVSTLSVGSSLEGDLAAFWSVHTTF